MLCPEQSGATPGSYATQLHRERQARLVRMSRIVRPAPFALPAAILVYPTYVFVDARGEVCACEDVDDGPVVAPSRVREIQDLVCKLLKVRRVDLLSARRDRMSVMARQIAMYLCKRYTPNSFPDLGRRFGGRDHTTVLHAVARVDLMVSTPRGTSVSRQWSLDYCDFVRESVALAEVSISTWPKPISARVRATRLRPMPRVR